MTEPSSIGSAASAPRVRINWRIAIPMTAVVIAVSLTQDTSLLRGTRPSPSFAETVIAPTLNWGLWLLLLPLVFAVARRGHARGFKDPGNVVMQIILGVGVALLHAILTGASRWSIGMTANRDLLVVVRLIVPFVLVPDMLHYWLIAAAYHMLAYHAELRERDVTEAHLAKSLAEARLDALERRLHPHFLFNTLNTIATLIRKDPPAASVMVGDLSDLLRASLHAEPGREVTLASELELLARYTAIQQTRFCDRLRVSVRAPADVLPAYVPHMILQPIVENAIRHGIAPREAVGTLTLEAERQGPMLRLIVRDDGVGFGRGPATEQGNGIGLDTTRARLSHLYGNEFSFEIDDAVPTGTVVTIDLPFHTDGPRGPLAVA